MMKGLLLLSGGIDSPVAAYMMKQLDVDLSAVHFSIEPITDNNPELKCRRISEKLGIKKLHVINVAKEYQEIATKCTHKHYFVLTKRLMYKIAEKIAKKEKCDFLVTGENLAQVSSQTLENLVVINKVVKIPVLRPLLGFDKNEIIKIAERIGTFEISKGPEVCDLFGPKHLSTRVDEEIILEEEKNLDLNINI